jgi:hypothetical protein
MALGGGETGWKVDGCSLAGCLTQDHADLHGLGLTLSKKQVYSRLSIRSVIWKRDREQSAPEGPITFFIDFAENADTSCQWPLLTRMSTKHIIGADVPLLIMYVSS